MTESTNKKKLKPSDIFRGRTMEREWSKDMSREDLIWFVKAGRSDRGVGRLAGVSKDSVHSMRMRLNVLPYERLMIQEAHERDDIDSRLDEADLVWPPSMAEDPKLYLERLSLKYPRDREIVEAIHRHVPGTKGTTVDQLRKYRRKYGVKANASKKSAISNTYKLGQVPSLKDDVIARIYAGRKYNRVN